jgi:hypothetical protein
LVIVLRLTVVVVVVDVEVEDALDFLGDIIAPMGVFGAFIPTEKLVHG